MYLKSTFTLCLALLCNVAAARDIHVSATQGNDSNPGTAQQPYRTVSKAAAEAMPGDIITVHEGTYRELVRPQRSGTKDRPIVYQAAPGEQVVITGSEPAKGWVRVDKDTWKLVIDNTFWQGSNPFDELIYGGWFYGEGKANHTGMVILNNVPTRETFSLEDVMKPIEGTPRWYAETGGNGGDILMNIGRVRPSQGAVYEPMDAAVERGDQAMCTENDRANIGYLREGSVIHYPGMDFGEGSETLLINVSTLAKSGRIEMRTDDGTDELLGECEVSNTGDWWKEKVFALNMKRALRGKHDIRLVTRAPKLDSSIPTVIYAQFPAGTDPNDGSVELTVRPQVFYPEHVGVDYITVRGFILQNAATNWAPPSAEQPGLIGPRWAKGWVIEDNTIRNSRCSGISLGRPTFGHAHHYQRMPAEVYAEPNGGQTVEQLKDFFENASWTKEEAGFHTIRRNHIHHCGQTGIVGCSGASFSLIEDNEIHDICRDENFRGYENAGIKFHFSTDVVLRHNHIYRAHWGIWLDWGNQGSIVERNLLHDNNAEDLFLEVCHGPMLICNNILLSNQSVILKSQGVAFAHNLITHNLWASSDVRYTYFYAPHGTTSVGKVRNVGGDHRWYNNLFVGQGSLGNWGKNDLTLPVWYDGNVFAQGAHTTDRDKTGLVDTTAIDLKFEEREDGWYLTLDVPASWTEGIRRPAVTSDLLGTAIIPQQRFTNPDGSPIKITNDLIGRKRKMSSPYPGPLEIAKPGLQTIKVWGK